MDKMYSTEISFGAEIEADLEQIRETLRKQKTEITEIKQISNYVASKFVVDCDKDKKHNESEDEVSFHYKFSTLNALVQTLECAAFLYKNEKNAKTFEPKHLESFYKYVEKLIATVMQLMRAVDSLEQIDVCLKTQLNEKTKKLFNLMKIE